MSKKHIANRIFLREGSHSFGSTRTLNAKKGTQLVITQDGILYTDSVRKILVPFANLSSIDLPLDSTYGQEESVPVVTQSIEVPKVAAKKAPSKK